MKITRAKFVELSAIAAGSVFLSALTSSFTSRKDDPLLGICGSWENSTLAKNAGCSFIEEGVGKILMPNKDEAVFKENFNTLKASQPLGVRSFIYFLPGEMKAVGTDANHDEIVTYADTAFKRAKLTGAKTIVFGSGKVRAVPDGFEKDKAIEQFISLCARLAEAAKKHDMILAVEQLNRGETNFINTMAEAAHIIDNVNHSHFKMVCDIYHALRENDPPSEIVKYKKHIVHCHIAEKEERTAPGVKGDDFTAYFKALKKINYQGGISFECKWKNMESELPVAVKTIREQYSKA